jgi:Holliday junction DNA helicase RuvB
MDDQRIISPQKCSFDESDSDRNLRPPSLSEFTGQDDIKESLSIAIEAAKHRGDSLDHCLFAGPPGLGKTTLSSIIAKEMGVNIHITSGPVLEKASDLAGLLTSLQENDILFIDEIHRLNRVVEEYLYPAMEDFRLDIMLDSGPAARSVNLPLKHFTLVGATTRSGLLTGPLRDRFGLQYRLELYNEKDIVKILMRSARILGVKLTGDAANILGGRCRGTPARLRGYPRCPTGEAHGRTAPFPAVHADNRTSRPRVRAGRPPQSSFSGCFPC